MSNSTKPSKLSPKGPEGVPVDAPGNEGPALSPHAVSRMHRAEDDAQAIEGSPEYNDNRAVAHDSGKEHTRWTPGSPGSGQRDDASRGLDSANTKNGDPNPSHHTAKRDGEAPRGRGDGELMEQPGSTTEARQPGPDTPAKER